MSTTSERINGFDALRTVAMWLGIVLHSIVVYKATPEPNWPRDPTLSVHFFDWLYDYIHIFRMPLFFLVAGFFARLVILRSGPAYFITQRFRRIVVPFIIGVITIVPLTIFPFLFYKFYNVEHLPAQEAWHSCLLQMFRWNGLVHLWFLYYLIIFYALSVGAKFVAGKLSIVVPGKWKRSMEKIGILRLLAVSGVLFLILWVNQMALPPVYTGIRPNLFYILYYGFFYGCGWCMQFNMKSVTSLTRWGWPLFITGTGLSVLVFLRQDAGYPVMDYLLHALQTISLVAGISGLFIRYCHAESKVWRYFSDAAYWVYLIHMCIVSSMQVLLINSSVVGWVRLPLVLIVAFGLSLLSYQFLVRYTVIGEFLHGKRKKPEKKWAMAPIK
ncbi:MAG TPA: acyltransferase family protein [Puia sp.]|nr:acyltransferase family protein [Puia sp.]